MSKVRSIKLDGFEPEILKVMAEIGNDVSKRIYEAKVAEIIAKRATPDCSKEQRENWIKAKYVTRAFINTEALNVSHLLIFLKKQALNSVYSCDRETEVEFVRYIFKLSSLFIRFRVDAISGAFSKESSQVAVESKN